MIACTRGMGSEAFKTTAIVLGVLDGLMILLLVAFIYLTRTPDITYTARVKKIQSQYKSYIQKINNLFKTNGYQIIQVDTFEEMLEIRDTIQAPILMYENDDKTCAKFMIPTDSKLLYLYEIKIDGYEEPEAEPMPESAPATVVAPNITNLVRPVVKVVVTPAAPKQPEAEIETLVEEPEVEIEAPEEEIPEVLVVAEAVEPEEVEPEEEEIPEVLDETEEEEVADILATIPVVEEDNEHFVDAIDVVWKERDKTYRYDPDGNTVEEGDIVLVPTRDVHSDKEVVREAEVAKGNYKVDPMELQHPLKKIIGVVRRKAEKVFAAMITPEENEENQENQD